MSKQGWFEHSTEHSLASRGIKTKQSKHKKTFQTHIPVPKTNIHEPSINWDLSSTDYGVFDSSIKHPDNPHRHYDAELRWLTPDEFIELQKKSIARFYHDTGRTPQGTIDSIFWRGVFPDHCTKIESYMKSGKKIPSFVIEIDDKGITQFQEGRHRAVVAKKLGIERIPVWILKRR